MTNLTALFLTVCLSYSPIQHVLAQASQGDSTLLHRGIEAYELENYGEAIKIFKRVLNNDSLHAEAHANLARAYSAKGDRIPAANHARLAVRHDRDHIPFLILRHQIGFINPRPLDRARKRRLLSKILDLDPGNAYANRERGRELAQVYFHHRDRVRVSDALPLSSPPSSSQNIALPDQAPTQIRDPFDINVLESFGYAVVPLDMRAKEAYPEAVAHLVRAVQTDPEMRPAYDLLMGLFAASGKHQEMFNWAETMKSFLPEDAYSHLYLGYASHQLQRSELAEESFLAAQQFLSVEDKVAFEDVSRIMNDDQKKQFKREKSDGGSEYWDRRDPLYLSSYNERENEHYARMVYAQLLFSEPKLDLNGWDSERGEIYIRYGAPSSMYYMTSAVEDCNNGVSPYAIGMGINNITNFHVFDYGEMKFVFGNPGSVGNIENQTEPNNVGVPPLNEFPLYSPCAVYYQSLASLNAERDYVIRSRSTIRETPTSYQLPGKVVDFPYMTTAFKGEGPQTDLLISFGFPIGSSPTLSQRSTTQTSSLGLDTGAFLIGADGVLTSNRYKAEDIYTQEILRFEGTSLWPGSHTLSERSGTYTLSVEFQRESDGAKGAKQDPIVLPDFTRSEFTMSELLLAYYIGEEDEVATGESPRGSIVRNQYDIQPSPWALYENGAPVYFYFELYNLNRGTGGTGNYKVEAFLIDEKSARKNRRRLLRRARRNQGGVAVSFEGQTANNDTGQYFIMDTEGLTPGTYVLIVQVTDTHNGKTELQEREIFVM